MKRVLMAWPVLLLVGSAASAQTVGWWRFEEGPVNSAAAGSGAVLDSSGNGHHATAVGNPVYRSVLNPGSAMGLEFNGTSSRIAVPDHSAFRLTESLTLEAYIRISHIAPGCCGWNQIVFRGDDRPAFDPYSLALTSDGRLAFSFDTSANARTTIMSPGPLGHGVDLHVAAVLDGAAGEMRLYVNHHLVQSAYTMYRPLGVLTGANPGIGIGNVQSGNYVQYFAGVIDEVRVSSAALTTGEMLPAACYANCDGSTSEPVLNVADFACFLQRFAAGDPHANCDFSVAPPVLNVADFACFLQRFAAGCF